jgi:hypothetical protein
MKMLRLLSILPLLMALAVALLGTGFCEESENIKALEIPEDCQLAMSDPELSKKSSSDSYLEAYIQGVIDSKYPDSDVVVTVRNGDVLLVHLPADPAQAQEIVSFVRDLTKRSVYETNPTQDISVKKKQKKHHDTWHGIWLPQSTTLFPTQVANPRQPCFSCGMRFHDAIGGQIASDIVIGAQFPVYRWANFKGGDLQLELEGAAFTVFNLREHTFPMINADYYVGVPLTFAKGPTAYRLRLYHVSSHVGDEYLCEHRHFKRKNKSFEAIDVSGDYQFNAHLRVYGILGTILLSDPEMRMKPLYVEYGFEARGPRTDFKQLFGEPFFAVHMQNWQDVNFAQDTTYALGYEWGKINGIGRKVRLFLEYHQGFSTEGQFSRYKTKYLGFRLTYGF